MNTTQPAARSSAAPNALDRRSLLGGALSLLGLQVPLAALTSREREGSGARAARQRSLVVIQLSGGNDGLSTIVPIGDDSYGRERRTTRLDARRTLRLDDYRGFHPALERLRAIWGEGGLAIVEGVGYPDAPRSHFKSLEVWHTGQRSGRKSGDGWLGKLSLELERSSGAPALRVHIGGSAPYSLHSSLSPAIALESPSEYRWFGGERERAAYGSAGLELQKPQQPAESSGRDALLRRLRGVLDGAQTSSERIRTAALEYRASVRYPADGLGARLHDIAALIHSSLGARIFSTSLSGFDTHADQRAPHDELMGELDRSLGAFLADLQHSEAGRDTIVVVFSEFGRRLAENGSNGTDHGKAAPMFVLGSGVAGGLYGEHPSLERLDEGDPTFTTDFRSVFASLVADGFGLRPEAVLGADYPRLGLLG